MSDRGVAGKNEPDWYVAARGLAAAIMFQRGTRGIHVVGRDGRTRMGCVDLLGCYAVDEAAKEFCGAAGIEFRSLEPPTEHEAMFMMAAGLRWLDWLQNAAAIRADARGTGHKSKVDLSALAQAIEARRAATGNTDAVHESAVAVSDAPKGGRHD